MLHALKSRLHQLVQPEVLSKLVELREELEKSDWLERYDYFKHHSELKEDCRYTKMAVHYFLEEHGDSVVNMIKWLNDNWAGKL